MCGLSEVLRRKTPCLSVLGNTCFVSINKQSNNPSGRSYCSRISHKQTFNPGKSTLALFVFWILTDNSDRSFSFDDLAFLADRLYR
jgi:hypothetical protein